MNALVIEDTKEVAETMRLCISIRWPGSQVDVVQRGTHAIEVVRIHTPEVVILDLALPDIDGAEVLREIRSFSTVPVLVVSVRDDENSRIMALEDGADDYITKPFSHTEFLSRIQAVLRRTHGHFGWKDGIITAGNNIEINLTARTIYKDGEEVDLSPIEWEFLEFGVKNAGKVISHRSLAKNVWGTEGIEKSAIKMCVRRLRQKIGDDAKHPRLIRSHRGMGYSVRIKEPVNSG